MIQQSANIKCTILLTSDEVAALVRKSKKSITRMVRQGLLPRPVYVGRTKRWRSEEVRKWLDSGCPPQAIFYKLFPAYDTKTI